MSYWKESAKLRRDVKAGSDKPKLDSLPVPGKPKKKLKKPFAIEYKCSFFRKDEQWDVIARYPTADRRDQALEDMRKNHNGLYMEFRPRND